MSLVVYCGGCSREIELPADRVQRCPACRAAIQADMVEFQRIMQRMGPPPPECIVRPEDINPEYWEDEYTPPEDLLP